ncbi:hypothetical protein C8R45DRAFT_783523, partial [Mycena sanguinolenta]
FPPEPLTDEQTHRILTKSALAVHPDCFKEAGCAVCGRLTRLTELTPITSFKPSLNILVVQGVTRKERKSLNDPVQELDGPVLAEGCNSVCVDC